MLRYIREVRAKVYQMPFRVEDWSSSLANSSVGGHSPSTNDGQDPEKCLNGYFRIILSKYNTEFYLYNSILYSYDKYIYIYIYIYIYT